MTERAYPTRNEVAIDPAELDLRASRMDQEDPYTFENHHGQFISKAYAASFILNTFRNLDIVQWRLAKDQHRKLPGYWGTDLHSLFGPPPIPRLARAYDVVEEQFMLGGRLRYGSQNNPSFYPISHELMVTLDREYNELNGRVA